MDSVQLEALAKRLIADPHDEEALASAHQAGASDPKSYATFLEHVGAETRDPFYAAHWLTEAANVWRITIGDVHRTARVLMQAIDRDPTNRTAAERLAELYREKGDARALVGLLEKRAKALASKATDPDTRSELAAAHEELGRLWNDSLQQPKKAVEHFRRAIEIEPGAVYAIYAAREIYKATGQWNDAYAMYAAELAVEQDPQRRLALLRDEAATRRSTGDLVGATNALSIARQIDDRDATLQQEYGGLIVERLASGEDVPATERTTGAELLVGLAEMYDGEHGFAYSGGALDIDPGHDRALQLYAYYARALQREEHVTARYLAYVRANPAGTMATEVRWVLAASYEAAGQLEGAIEALEPLRAAGDAQATAKLRELYAALGKPMPPAPAPVAALIPPAPPSQPARPSGTPSAPAWGPSPPDTARAPAPPETDPAPLRAVATLPTERRHVALEKAQAFANAGRRAEAFQKYREVLAAEPNHPEALAWVEDYLRSKRDYAGLRTVLGAAARAPGGAVEQRTAQLRELASLCEGNLRDTEGALQALRQLLSLDRTDEAARQSLVRLLEKAHRWDELGGVIEQEAAVENDVEKKIALEKRVASIHEQKRNDFSAAADAWARICDLTPEDDDAILTASKLYEKAGAVDRAAAVIADGAPGITNADARGSLLQRLGELREQLKDPAGAGDAYAEAAGAQVSERLWDAAERCFVDVLNWNRAAEAAVQRAGLAPSAEEKAQHLARAANHFAHANDDANVLANLERATDLDPLNDEYALALTDRYSAGAMWSELAEHYVKRGERLSDVPRRVRSRRAAASIFGERLDNKDAAREMWSKVLEDGEDREALEHLVDDAISRNDATEAAGLLSRLVDATEDPSERAKIALREAGLRADGLGDVTGAITRYEQILADYDSTCRPALQAIADLHEAADRLSQAAHALERELPLVGDPVERSATARRLAHLYEQIDEPEKAIRSLEIVRTADPKDFDALARLCNLCERTKKWDRTAVLLAERIEGEPDSPERSALTHRLAIVLADELGRGDDALAALAPLADANDPTIRSAYIELGDRLERTALVATKLVEWWLEAPPSPERIDNLRGAFSRFASVGRDEDAVRVGAEIVRCNGADRALAERLEGLSVKVKDLVSLTMVQDRLVRDLKGTERAHELARQAEARLAAGAPPLEALQHGETGLIYVLPEEAEALLTRLARLAEQPGDVVDMYERQISRCESIPDRVRALARAAQVAAERGLMDRASALFDIVLSGSLDNDSLSTLEDSARAGDAAMGGDRLRRALCAAMASGGQSARDGGKTRGSLLRRAASMVFRDIHDVDRAFSWLGEALVAHVDAPTLDALEELAHEVGTPQRAEETLGRALGEVFEAPLVRELLARRARLRRDSMADKAGAAGDLRKLYELAPADHQVAADLAALYTDLGDHHALVSLYEDQIIRTKDPATRADLARRVAHMWETELADAREAADAWRRVLRLNPKDAEAMAGLERMKAAMLRRVSLPDSAPRSTPELPADSSRQSANEASAQRSVRAASGGGSEERKSSPQPVATQPSAGSPGPGENAGLRGAPAGEGAETGNNEPTATASAEGQAGGKAPAETVSASSMVGAPKGDAVSAGSSGAVASAAGAVNPADDDVLVADDMAVMLDDEPAKVDEKPAQPVPKGRRKKSVPPPLPRG
jgi:tetratricopeptide (TPR) repeat protein